MVCRLAVLLIERMGRIASSGHNHLLPIDNINAMLEGELLRVADLGLRNLASSEGEDGDGCGR